MGVVAEWGALGWGALGWGAMRVGVGVRYGGERGGGGGAVVG